MAGTLDGKTVAILATHGFEQSELQEPKRRLEALGARCDVVSPGDDASIKGWKDKDWGDAVAVDVQLSQAKAESYDALVLPGGVINPDSLRTDAAAIAFVKAFDAAAKPIAAICHGPWLLAEAGVAKDRKVTSWPSVKTDLKNAGADWHDAEVIVDGHIITSRRPDDIPAFSEAVAKSLVA